MRSLLLHSRLGPAEPNKRCRLGPDVGFGATSTRYWAGNHQVWRAFAERWPNPDTKDASSEKKAAAMLWSTPSCFDGGAPKRSERQVCRERGLWRGRRFWGSRPDPRRVGARRRDSQCPWALSRSALSESPARSHVREPSARGRLPSAARAPPEGRRPPARHRVLPPGLAAPCATSAAASGGAEKGPKVLPPCKRLASYASRCCTARLPSANN